MQSRQRTAQCSVVALAILFGHFSRAFGQESPAARTSLSIDIYARANPTGLALSLGVLRHYSIADGLSLIEQGRYYQAGVFIAANPAYSQASVVIEAVPLAVLQLRLQYDTYVFFGANGSLLRFNDSHASFGADDLARRAGDETRAVGHRVLFSPVLRAQVQRLILRNQTDLAWYALANRPGYYYEAEYDTLLARRDLLVNNRLTALWTVWRGAQEAMLLTGPGYELTFASRARLVRHRAEIALFWQPVDAAGVLSRPRLLALAGINVVDPNVQNQGFVVLGVGADFDL